MRETGVLLHGHEDGVTTLTLNRPGRFNALSDELIEQMLEALEEVARDESTRVVILAGAGDAFCAGHDLKEMRRNPGRQQYHRQFSKSGKMMTMLATIPQPVIARVHGMAVAAGCQLVASCDLAVASSQASFAVSGVKLGLFCSTPAVALSRNISRKRALEMLLTGDFISAETAAGYGLVNRTVEPGLLDGTVRAMADSIAAHPPRVVALGKQMFYRQLEQQTTEAYLGATDVISGNMLLEETVEGIDAFIEKRKPDWRRGSQ